MGRKYSLKFVLALVFATLALTCALTAGIICLILISPNAGSTGPHSGTPADYGFGEMLGIISDRYIGTYDADELIVAAKRAVVDSLDDHWSYYMTPDEYEQYIQSSENMYQGIGVEVHIDEETGGIKVTYVYNNSGAHMAGIVVGDVITAVDGESIRGFTLTEVRGLLRRPLDETALLTVLRANGEYQDLPVAYSAVFADPVSFEMLDGGIGYVMLRNFEGDSAQGFISAVNTLMGQGAKAFIYDVRSNYGGRVTEMTRILDFLLPEGEIFVAVNTFGTEQITKSGASFIDLPAVVLVNAHSYSGAEYFTAVLSEFNYAVTVGEQTTGKNRMQTTLPLNDGGAIHISTGMYMTPNRVSLYDVGGYTPDYQVPLTEEELQLYYRGELSHEDDPQLHKAIELLNKD